MSSVKICKQLFDDGIIDSIDYSNCYGFSHKAKIICNEAHLTAINEKISKKEIMGGIIEVSIYKENNTIFYDIVSIYYLKNISKNPKIKYINDKNIPTYKIWNQMGKLNFKFDFLQYTIDDKYNCEIFLYTILDKWTLILIDLKNNNHYYLFRVIIILNNKETLLAFYSEPNTTSIIKFKHHENTI